MSPATQGSLPPRIGLAAVALLALAGCSYSYKNPVEALGPGEVGGRTVAGATLVIDGVAVSVKGAALDGVSRSNGHFSMLPLPPGHHTLMFRKGLERALQRDVDIGYGSDGQVQGIWLGDVTIPAAVSLAGSCAPTDGHGLAENGIAVDEASGAVVPISAGSPGSFTFEGLAIGQHRVRVYATDQDGVEYVGGPATVEFLATDAGTRKTVAQIEMHRAVKAPPVPATVKITLGVSGSLPGLRLSDLVITGLPTTPSVGSNGSAQVEVPEGLWTLGVTLPASLPGATAPPPVTFVALAGMSIDLGTLYAVTDSAQNQAASSCRTDADCAPGTCTTSHVCDAGYHPPPQAPASMAYCDLGWRGCAAGQPLGGVWNNTTGSYDPPITLTCVQAGTETIGVACGSCCTPDGVAQACAPADSGGCNRVPKPATFAISGTVSGAVAAGVQVWILGPGADTGATTDANGAYAFTGLTDGTYNVAPYLAGYTFVPASLDVVVNGADVPLQDFTSVSAFHVISGTVSGAAVAGVTVALSGGASMTTTTDWTGAWAFYSVLDGNYTVTPSLGVYSFSPASQAVSLAGADSGGWGFTSSYGWMSLPTVIGSNLYAVSGASSSNVWAVGARGAVIHFNGVNWVTIPSGTIYDLNGVWSSSTGDTWAVGQLGTILHWNGSAWVSVSSPDTMDLRAIWGSSSSDLWAVGFSGVVLHYDGTSWTYSAGVLFDSHYAVWGSSATDVWAVSGVGTIQRWNGSSWSAVSSGTNNSLHGIWGSGPNDAWAVGASGTVLHWDGSAWSAVASGTTDDFLDVWGSAANDVWAVGNGGSVIHYDGTVWSQVYLAPIGLTGVWGSSASDVWAVGGNGYMFHLSTNHVPPVTHSIGGTMSGALVSGVSVTLSGAAGALTFTAGTGTYSFYGLGDGSYTLTPSMPGYTFTPASRQVTVSGADVVALDFTSAAVLPAVVWQVVASGTINALNCVWGLSANDAWAVGNGGTILHWNGATWTSLASGTTQNLLAIWGSSGTDVWAAGGAGALLHWDGSSWTPYYSGDSFYLRSIWGSSSSDVWVVGDGYAYMHWNGVSWTFATTVPTTANNPYSIWGFASNDIWVGTQGGQTFHYDGTSWTSFATGLTDVITALWGSGPTDLWAGGAFGAGSIVHSNGSGWSLVASPASGWIDKFWGSGASDVYGVNDVGSLLHWDGASWSLAASGTTAALYGIWGSAPNDIWAVGDLGTILHRASALGTSSISGRVTGAATAGVTIQLSGDATISTVTDATGAYSFSGLAAGSYTVTPVAAAYFFTPATISVTVTTSSTANDFVANAG